MENAEIGSYGYQSRKMGSLDEVYGFKTYEEAMENSEKGDGWNTIIFEIVENEYGGKEMLIKN